MKRFVNETEDTPVRKMPYDLRRGHKRIVSQQGNLIIQDGIVYEFNSGRVLGPVAEVAIPSKGVIMCQKSGATFPDTEYGKQKLQQWQEERKLTDKPVKKGEVLPEADTDDVRKAIAEEKEAKGKTKVRSGGTINVRK